MNEIVKYAGLLFPVAALVILVKERKRLIELSKRAAKARRTRSATASKSKATTRKRTTKRKGRKLTKAEKRAIALRNLAKARRAKAKAKK